MAVKLDAGPVTRGEVYRILPENIIVNHDENSRCTRRTPEEIESFAQRILRDGQKTPCRIRKIEGNKVKLVFGYGRHEAIDYINKHLNPPEPLKVSCILTDCNEQEAFIESLIENIDRSDTNDIDNAHAQRVLREKFGWEEERIAEFYERSVSWVTQHRKLLQLSPKIQDEIKSGNLPMATSLLLAELPESEREKVVEEAKDANGKVQGTPIKQRVRAQRQVSGTGKGTGRSLKELKEYLNSNVGVPDWNDQPAVKELCNTLLDYIEGKKTDKQMNNSLEKNCRKGK